MGRASRAGQAHASWRDRCLWRVGALALTLLSSVVLLGAGPAGRATADPISDCSASTGVLVVVDFGHWKWDPPVYIGCAPASGTGYDAMLAAGFITAGTDEDGPAFICRIGLAAEKDSSFEPTQAEDPCVNTPPVTAYWSYWHADANSNTWSYTEEGAMTYLPPAGSIDAWTFGASEQPSFSPADVLAAVQSGGSGSFIVAPPAPPTTAAPTDPSGGGSGPSASRPATDPAKLEPGSGSDAQSAATTPASSPSAGHGARSGAASASAPAAISAAGRKTTMTSTGPGAPAASGGPGSDATLGTGSGGSPAGFRIVASPAGAAVAKGGSPGPPEAFIAGLAAVVVLGGSGGVVAWRRRRSPG